MSEWKIDIAQSLRAEVLVEEMQSSGLDNCARELIYLRDQSSRYQAALGKIAGFAPGNGDVCEIIARICREALRDE